MKLLALINQLEEKINTSELRVNSVSASSVGWHIQHSLLVIVIISKAIIASDPNKYKWKFSIIREVFFLFKTIRRGKTKAPKAVVPTTCASAEQLYNEIVAAKAIVLKLKSQSNSCFFKHPFLGDIRLKNTILFLEIHTQHHIKIINNILQ